MQVTVNFPQLQTLLFLIVFGLALIFSSKRYHPHFSLAKPLTNELKGFAILGIIFSHIGYFLSKDPRFLFPLSIFAGLGVNLFLFLSGFGLATSYLKNGHTIKLFYKKRLQRIFIPLWIVLIFLLLFDWATLHITYPWQTILGNFLGWYPTADIYQDLNSSLWYFSLILFYYLIFPLVFHRKIAYLSPIIITVISYLLFSYFLPSSAMVLKLYNLHFIAFPLGIVLALVNKNTNTITNQLSQLWNKTHLIPKTLRFFILAILLLGFSYFSINSNVGQGLAKEQLTSLFSMGLLLFIFVLKSLHFKLLSLFGTYSYEIYLIHWPLVYRYDLLYKYLPPFLATLFYLVLFIILGYLLQKAVQLISQSSSNQALEG